MSKLEAVAQKALGLLPPRVRDTAYLRLFAFTKVRMIGYTQPTVVALNDDRCVVRIPLSVRTRNHLGSMYFGALAVGADCAGGLMAMRLITAGKDHEGGPVSLVFKDFFADYLKRPEGDVEFSCEDGPKIRALVKKAQTTGERVNETVVVTARCPDKLGDEPVANFRLTLSLKRKAK